jgi:hypothetical protein
MPSAPNWKNRRLAARAKRVQARRSGDAPVIAAYGATLPGKADTFIAAYDAAAGFEVAWRKKLNEGRQAINVLDGALRSWLPLLGRDVPGFDASSFSVSSDVPDDLLRSGERLGAYISEHRDGAGAPLAYKDAALAEIELALAAAQTKWAEAEAADAQDQKLLRGVRTSAVTFDTELKAFRRSLQVTFGRSDKDFQKLRAERAARPDEEDDAGAPAPPKPSPPAAQSTRPAPCTSPLAPPSPASAAPAASARPAVSSEPAGLVAAAPQAAQAPNAPDATAAATTSPARRSSRKRSSKKVAAARS